MSSFNGTGAQGFGVSSGRGLGPCGRGMRKSSGQGFGRRGIYKMNLEINQ